MAVDSLKLSSRKISVYKPVYAALEQRTALASPLRWHFRLWGIRVWDASTGKEIP